MTAKLLFLRQGHPGELQVIDDAVPLRAAARPRDVRVRPDPADGLLDGEAVGARRVLRQLPRRPALARRQDRLPDQVQVHRDLPSEVRRKRSPGFGLLLVLGWLIA